MTSAITFTFQLLADHPEVLAKVREEQDALRGHDVNAPLDQDIIDKMQYTRAVAKEALRLRPPVIMVPYATTKPFQISEDYTVPAGSMVRERFSTPLSNQVLIAITGIAHPLFLVGPILGYLSVHGFSSLTCEARNSLHDPNVYPDPDAFQPERWLEGGNSVNSSPKNCMERYSVFCWLSSDMMRTFVPLSDLVFGAGPHKCIGQDYVFLHMTAVLGTAAFKMEWDHEVTPESGDYSIIPTIFPKVCLIFIHILR
jgi:C-22 sterol desaturase